MSVEESPVPKIETGDFVDYMVFRCEVKEIMEVGGRHFLRLIMEGAEFPRVDAREVKKVVIPPVGRETGTSYLKAVE